MLLCEVRISHAPAQWSSRSWESIKRARHSSASSPSIFTASWHNEQRDVLLAFLKSSGLAETIDDSDLGKERYVTAKQARYLHGLKLMRDAHAETEVAEFPEAVPRALTDDDYFMPIRDKRAGTHSRVAVLLFQLHKEHKHLAWLRDHASDMVRRYAAKSIQQHWVSIRNAIWNDARGTPPDSDYESLQDLWAAVSTWL